MRSSRSPAYSCKTVSELARLCGRAEEEVDEVERAQASAGGRAEEEVDEVERAQAASDKSIEAGGRNQLKHARAKMAMESCVIKMTCLTCLTCLTGDDFQRSIC